MAKLISKTYGDALLELAIEENQIEDFSAELATVLDVLQENPDFSKLMNHPRVSVEEKEEVITNVFSDRIHKELVGFLLLIVRKGRYENLYEILQYFLDRVKEYKGIGVAYVTTPMELKDAQKKEVEDKLLKTTDYKEMEMHFDVDSSLIGGMQIRIGDRVVDSSVLTKIQKMQQDLMKIQL